jgi:Protein of unknown function (DUF2637)
VAAQEGRTPLMSDYPVVRGTRSGDPHPRLRLAALTAVIVGVLLVAAAAFLLSYEGIHQIALQAGVSPRLARLYPVMFDAMLVIACAAALALRSAGWWTRAYVWTSLLLLLAALAAGDAVHAMGISLPVQPTQAVVAILPWVLLLLGFGMWLAMLRHWRRLRAAAAANGAAAGRAAGGIAAGQGTVTWAASGGTAAGRAGAPRAAIDSLLEPRAGRPAERAGAVESRAAAELTAGYWAGAGHPQQADQDQLEEAGTGLTYEAEGTQTPEPAEHGGPQAAPAGAGEPPAPPIVPAPTPVPHFDRMRSTPTPPQEPGPGQE